MKASRGCSSGKVGYTLKVEATSRADSAARWHKAAMRVYRCPECRLWHTSRKRKSK